MADAEVDLSLGRLWKGTLFVGIGATYLLILALLFLQHGWRASLLALVFLGGGQLFRYIANDVDRIGWRIESIKTSETTRRTQKRLLILLVTLAQLTNGALIIQAFFLAGRTAAIAMVLGLALVEVLYLLIRKVNRRVEFERASYGFRDGEKARTEELELKLAQLQEMAERGEISRASFERIRDRYRIHKVMGDDRILRDH